MKILHSIFLILFVTLKSYSQINNDSVSFYIFEMMNNERERLGIPKRYLSSYCKKASEVHTSYIKKYSIFEGHYESKVIIGKKVLEEPIDRYNYFNKDSIKVCVNDYSYYKRIFEYESEVAQWKAFIGLSMPDLTRKDINKFFAKIVFDNFMKSEHHKRRLLETLNNLITRGYFIFDYRLNSNDNLEIFCVGVFDITTQNLDYHKSVYKSDYKKIY
jgi:hypothetical protein